MNKHTRDTVARSSHNKRIIESEVADTRRNHLIPILRTLLVPQSQMPLTDNSGFITGILKHICHRITLRTNDKPSIAIGNPRPLPTPCVLSCQHGITRRSACSRSSMYISKSDTTFRQTLYIRRVNRTTTVTAQISIADIIRINKHHIRFLTSCFTHLCSTGHSQQQQRTEDISFFHKYLN